MATYKYNLGEVHNGRKPYQWDDLDPETQSRIAESVVSTVASFNTSFLESIKPSLDVIQSVVLPRLSNLNIYDLLPASTWDALRRVGEFLRDWVPNWSSNVDAEKAWDITGQGIALAFVPRSEVVEQVIAADNYEARVGVLVREKQLILNDCREALQADADYPLHESIAMLPQLLVESIDVLEAGHYAAACALAVDVIDSANGRVMPQFARHYQVRLAAAGFAREEAVAAGALRTALAMRPLISILRDWRANAGMPVPSTPSRHAVAHGAHPDYMGEADAILFVMAAVSLLLGFGERQVAESLAAESGVTAR